MKRFNPDKELKKLQHGNKNKIIFGVIALLLIITIGSSYALYQVRYSKRIIYTKVAPFYNEDLILTILVDGNRQNSLPDKNTGYYFDGIECETDQNASAKWDYVNWKLTMLTVTVPNKCDIKFTSTPSTLKAQIEHDKEINSELVVEDETTDKNLRYIGKDPNNYIWFNCDNYELVINNVTATEQKCEKWRIIGLMNNMTVIDESIQEEIKNQSLVKIIRADSIGAVAWDSAKANNWSNASLQKSLNSTYYNGTNLGVGKGITPSTRKMIGLVRWHVGATSNDTANTFYINERNSTTWNGRIALMYPSDYGYATSGGDIGREECLKINLNTWSNTECSQNSWLRDSSSNQFTLTPSSGTADKVFGISSSGDVFEDYVFWSPAEHPSLYLTSDPKIINGDGSSNTPYILVP